MPETETPVKRSGFFGGLKGLFRDLILGKDGKPDEAALAFLLGVVAIIALKTYATICPSHPFNAAEFSAGYGGLLSFYNASKGVLNKLGSS